MHVPSEHSIDGKVYPLELHFVHIAKAKNCDLISNKLTVVGVMVEIDEQSNLEFITTWFTGHNH